MINYQLVRQGVSWMPEHRPWEPPNPQSAIVEIFRNKAINGLTAMSVAYCRWKHDDNNPYTIGDVARIVQELSETHFDIEIPLHGSNWPDRVAFKRKVENDAIRAACLELQLF